MRLNELNAHFNEIFRDYMVKDYCVNGLQIGDTKGNKEIRKVVTGVTFEQELLDRAIDEGADAIFVHHGLFWNYQNHEITGLNYEKIQQLVKNDIALFAYHLPLDFHPMLGNNAVLFKTLAEELEGVVGWTLLSSPDEKTPVSIYGFAGEVLAYEFVEALAKITGQNVDQIRSNLGKGSNPEDVIKTVGVCTGGGQNYFRVGEYDAYITGEPGLPQMIKAKENGTLFVAAGHHCTETFGAKEMANYIQSELGIESVFYDIEVDA